MYGNVTTHLYYVSFLIQLLYNVFVCFCCRFVVVAFVVVVVVIFNCWVVEGECLRLFSDNGFVGSAAEVDTKFVVISFCACAHFTLTAALEVVFGQVGGTAPLPCADALKQRATGYASAWIDD